MKIAPNQRFENLLFVSTLNPDLPCFQHYLINFGSICISNETAILSGGDQKKSDNFLFFFYFDPHNSWLAPTIKNCFRLNTCSWRWKTFDWVPEPIIMVICRNLKTYKVHVFFRFVQLCISKIIYDTSSCNLDIDPTFFSTHWRSLTYQNFNAKTGHDCIFFFSD